MDDDRVVFKVVRIRRWSAKPLWRVLKFVNSRPGVELSGPHGERWWFRTYLDALEFVGELERVS